MIVDLFTGATGPSALEDVISSGLPSYIIQEEFDRYTGYWWQPIDTASLGRFIGCQSICFE